MIGCNKKCIELACCHFCIWAIKDEITTEPIGCSLHEDARHQDLAISLGACNDFHCFGATKPERWLVIDVCDT